MATKTKRKTSQSQKPSTTKRTRYVQAIWVGIDAVVRSITKIQRRTKKDGCRVELHELKRLGREYASLINRLPADNDK